MRSNFLRAFSVAFAILTIATVNNTFGQNVRATNAQIRTLLQRIETKTDTFKLAMERSLDRSMLNNTNREDRIMNLIGDFEIATDGLRDRFNSRQTIGSEATNVLNSARFIDSFMTRNRLNANVQNQWASIRTDLDTLATYYRVSWSWTGTGTVGGPYVRPYTVNDNQMRSLLARIENKTDLYKRQMERSLDRSLWNDTRSEDSINNYISQFENATDRLRTRFNSNQTVMADASEVLNRALYIDRFMTSNRLPATTQNRWNNLKTDLNTLATYYRVSWNWNQVPFDGSPVGGPYVRPYFVNDNQMRTLLARIENNTDLYKRQMERTLDRSLWNDTRSEDSINNYIAQFESATDRLRTRFNSNQTVTADASEVLNRALYIDRFMSANKLPAATTNRWNNVKTDLNTLASYYRVSWNWNQVPVGIPSGGRYAGYPGYPGAFDRAITGTYRLNTSLSDNVSTVIARDLMSIPAARRTTMQRNLEQRLRSPEMIAVEKRGSNFTMASSNAGRGDFVADGVARTETNNRGRQITTTVNATYDGIVIENEGDRINDFYVMITPVDSDRLRITRRVYLENQNETITVNSIYDKTDSVARWNNVNTRPGWNTPVTAGEFYVPNGARLTAVLRNEVNTRSSQVGDRFTMEVTAPNQYRGAIIEGYVAEAERSGRFTGRSNISLSFDQIRLTDGRTFRFAGLINQVTPLNGDNISINNEGTIRDSNQTTQTVTRAGIGAVLGAIIGAIAGGGEGAAIGAGVGAGAGAGSVLITGRDHIELQQGSTFQITASSPANVGRNY